MIYLTTVERLALIIERLDEYCTTETVYEEAHRYSAEGIETRGTAYLVLRLLRDDEMDASEARDVLDETIDAGWYRT